MPLKPLVTAQKMNTEALNAAWEKHRASSPYVIITTQRIRARMHRALKRAEGRLYREIPSGFDDIDFDKGYCEAVRNMLKLVK